ncbi:MAG: Holliday junction resolvase RuvX [Oscillospiraceae bacterium]|nr:Holliday junction resolvase RuvX [Oscillospiraceae bacterium]
MKIMAIDYGDARTGVAVSDPLGMMAGFTAVVAQWNKEKAADAVAQIAKQQGAQALVMGFPKNMDGTEGARAPLYREFADMLEQRTGLKPVLWDERRTSIDAHQILAANGRKAQQHRKSVDAVAASLILEGYLAYLKNQK